MGQRWVPLFWKSSRGIVCAGDSPILQGRGDSDRSPPELATVPWLVPASALTVGVFVLVQGARGLARQVNHTTIRKANVAGISIRIVTCSADIADISYNQLAMVASYTLGRRRHYAVCQSRHASECQSIR